MEIKKGNRITREFGLSNMALNNRMSVFLILILIAFSGIYSYVKMPKEAFPEIVIPTIFVGTPYSGNSPVDMENLVTRPLEREINNVSGVVEMRSTSQQDFSNIIVEFGQDVDISRALQDVKDAVDRAKSDLPGDLDRDPNVFEIDFSEMPIMYINVAGDFDERELKHYAELLQDDIEDLREISGADIRGARSREISIDIDFYKMTSRQINFRDIDDAIKEENVTLSAGEIRMGNHRRGLRVTGEFESVEEIRNLIVKSDGGDVVYLRDIAEVRDDFEEHSSFARSGRMPVLTLEVVKRSNENLLDAADKIQLIISEAQNSYLPSGLDISITNDLSRITRNQVANLENSIISGVILVVLVILFFMGIRNALFVGIAIPLSMFSAFMLLFMLGVTMNIIVLFALILALGLLVDNGIVVVENIYRYREEGLSPLQAAKEGAGEVAFPIISSTATTLSAFLPLLFWDGIVGEFMKYLPITLIIVLASSLFIALVISPVLTAYWMKVEEPGKKHGKGKPFLYAGILFLASLVFYLSSLPILGGLMLVFGIIRLLVFFVLTPASHWFLENAIPALERFYERLLRAVIQGYRPFALFAFSVVILICSMILFVFKLPQVSFFPQGEPNYINIFAEFPAGTDIYFTDSVTKEIEERVFATVDPYGKIVESVIANVGEGASDPMDAMGEQATPNKSRITVSFEEFEHREGISTEKVLGEIRNAIRDLPGVQITIERERMGPPVGRPINIEIVGPDFNDLIAISDDVKSRINESPIAGIEELRTDLETQRPEIGVRINRDQARRFGLSTESVAFELRTALFGLESSQFKEGEDEYPIMIRLREDQRHDATSLVNQPIIVREGGEVRQVPISTVASLDYSTTYGSISRIDMDRVVSVYSNVEVGFNANAIVGEIQELLSGYELPPGYFIRFTGEQQEQDEAADFLTQALMISVFLIFLILVSQFNSFIKPFLIIVSVVFSTIGVMLGLVIFQMEFVVVMTGIGIISLAGVVVNNAIVLIDFTDLQRKRHREQLGLGPDDRLPDENFLEAVVEGGKIRLRPVLLTAITTILGLLPLATGMNINFETLLTHFNPQIYFGGDNAVFWGPMSWTVIFGLFFATFMTLLVLPAMYVIAHRAGHFLANLFGMKEPDQ